jgi:hypothetical protein
MRCLLFALTLSIFGCVSMPKELEPTTPADGIVIGEMIQDKGGLALGIGISFKEMNTGKMTGVPGAKMFSLKLPPGDYQLYSHEHDEPASQTSRQCQCHQPVSAD